MKAKREPEPQLKEPVALVLVDDEELIINPGEAVPYFNKEKGVTQLILACPYCGRVSASAGKHSYNPSTKSYHPSIVHNRSLGGCGWHGWLRGGWFKNA